MKLTLKNFTLLFFIEINQFLSDENNIIDVKNKILLKQFLLIKKNIARLLLSTENCNLYYFKKHFHIHYILVRDYHNLLLKINSSRIKKYLKFIYKMRKLDLDLIFREGIIKQLRYIALEKKINDLPIKEKLKVHKYFDKCSY